MWVWLPLLAFALGVIVGRFSVRRYRHDRIAWAQRRLQLKVLSLEVQQNLMTLTPLITNVQEGEHKIVFSIWVAFYQNT